VLHWGGPSHRFLDELDWPLASSRTTIARDLLVVPAAR
jgi:hypothetical protein